MTNFEVLKQMPLKNFADLLYPVTQYDVKSKAEFVKFLESEIPAHLEGVVKTTLNMMQCRTEESPFVKMKEAFKAAFSEWNSEATFYTFITQLDGKKLFRQSVEQKSGEVKQDVGIATDIDAAIKSVAAKITEDKLLPNEYADTVKALAELVRARSLLD